MFLKQGALPRFEAGPGPPTMSSRGSQFAPSEKVLTGDFGAPRPPEPVPAVLWGPDDDTRLLLRGLLRLHRYPVAYEARTIEELEQLPSSVQPRLLLVDVPVEAGHWSAELERALRVHIDLRPVVILPAGRPAAEAEAIRAGARAVLPRPFVIQEFVRALAKALS